MGDTPEIKKDEQYAIRPQDKEERGRIKNSDDDILAYLIQLDLSDDQVERLKKDVFLEFDALKKEREDLGLDSKWLEKDNQYAGKLRKNDRLMFNLHVHQTKIKEDSIVRALNEAFLDSDPKFDISPRPESSRKDGQEVAQRQADYLDYSIDEEVCPDIELAKINHSAVRKFVGIGKLSFEYNRGQRRREETYEGKPEIVGINQQGQPVIKNEGLEHFLKSYPDAQERYPSYVERLSKGEKINIVSAYWDIIDNNPEINQVKIENFYVSNGCKGNKGLRTEHLIGERQEYTYWELLEKEESGEFTNVQELITKHKGTDTDSQSGDYKTQKYNIMEFTYHFKLNESDDRETKIKCWFDEDDKIFLGAIYYPYYGFDIDYIAFYVKINEKGFYGNCESVVDDIKDSNIAQDVLLNLGLHGLYVRNIITPIVKEGSEIEAIFLEKKFIEGSPIPVDELTEDVNKAFSFVQWPNVDLQSTLALNQYLKKDDDDVTGVSSLMSGRESPTDPTAPAAKTIALLQQSGINIKDYIRIYLPSFNLFASNLLQLYYQMSNNDRKFRIKKKSMDVSGADVFATVSREEMVMKTTIQARAASFAFDKMNEKKEDLAMYQIIKSDAYLMQQPRLVHKAVDTLMRSFGAKWKVVADTVLMSPEQLEAQLKQAALQAVMAIMQQQKQASEAAGVNVPVDPNKMAQAVGAAQAGVTNPQILEGKNEQAR